MNVKTLQRTLKAARIHMGTDFPVIAGVHLVAKDGTLTVEATDRFTATRMVRQGAGTGEWECLLDKRALWLLESVISGEEGVTLDLAVGLLLVDAGPVFLQVPVPVVDQSFPNVAGLIASSEGEPGLFHVGLSPALISRIGSWTKAMGVADHAGVAVSHVGGGKPVLIAPWKDSARDMTSVMLLMPRSLR